MLFTHCVLQILLPNGAANHPGKSGADTVPGVSSVPGAEWPGDAGQHGPTHACLWPPTLLEGPAVYRRWRG